MTSLVYTFVGLLLVLMTSCSFNFSPYGDTASYSNEGYGYVLSNSNGDVLDSLNPNLVQQVNLGARRFYFGQRNFSFIPSDISSLIVETTAGSNLFGKGIRNDAFKDRIETAVRRAGFAVPNISKRQATDIENQIDSYGSTDTVPTESPIPGRGILSVSVSPPRTEYYTYQFYHYSIKLHAEITSRASQEIWSSDLVLDAVVLPRYFRGEYRDRMEDDIMAGFCSSIRKGGPSTPRQVADPRTF